MPLTLIVVLATVGVENARFSATLLKEICRLDLSKPITPDFAQLPLQSTTYEYPVNLPPTIPAQMYWALILDTPVEGELSKKAVTVKLSVDDSSES